MKKTKLLSLLSLLLLLGMLLVACGGTGADTVEVGDLLDKNAAPMTATYGSITQVDGLSDVSSRGSAGVLYYFTTTVEVGSVQRTKHIVYNAATNTILLTLTDSATLKYNVELLSGYSYELDEEYFCAYVLGSVNYDYEGDPTGSEVALYTADGTRVDSVTYTKDEMQTASRSYSYNLDLVLFDDVLYRATNEGFEVLCEASPFAVLPSITALDEKVGKYYYAAEDGRVTFYDLSLELKSSYEIPAYAEDVVTVPLSNGNLLIQYKYIEDVLSDDYDYLDDGVKYQLVTEIVKAKNGKAEQIPCEYLLDNDIDRVSPELYGFKEGKVSQIAEAIKITDRRVGEETLLLISEEGKLSEVAPFHGEQVNYITLVAEGLWELETEDHSYLINRKGKILANLSSASCYRSAISCDGKLYDYDLNEIYDYKANGMEYVTSSQGSIVFRKEVGDSYEYDYYLFTGSSTLRKIADAQNDDVSYYGTFNGGYILRDMSETTTKYVYYNADGSVALTLRNPNSWTTNTLSSFAWGETYTLYTAKNADGDTVVYRMTITR